MNSPLTCRAAAFTFLLLAVSAPLLRSAPDAAAPYPGKAYLGKAQEIPGTIQAEFYDVAPGNANGITYNRKGEPRPGSIRTTGDCIGLGRIDPGHVSVTGEKETDGGAYVGWTDVGDWWNYTVRVTEDGTYDFGLKIAAGGKGGIISASFVPMTPSGTAANTGPLEIPTTAGFQPGVEVYHVWEKLDKLATVKLAKGLYVMTVKVEKAGGFNMDYYTLAAAK